jgi:hypothetical protein
MFRGVFSAGPRYVTRTESQDMYTARVPAGLIFHQHSLTSIRPRKQAAIHWWTADYFRVFNDWIKKGLFAGNVKLTLYLIRRAMECFDSYTATSRQGPNTHDGHLQPEPPPEHPASKLWYANPCTYTLIYVV